MKDDGRRGGGEVLTKILPKSPSQLGSDPVKDPNTELNTPFGNVEKMSRIAWDDFVNIAGRHNEPSKFTTLIGWGWSSIPSALILHRMVMSPNGGDDAKSYTPFGSDQSQYPQDLWRGLE